VPGSFPIALDLRGRRCLIVGQGEEAALRARALLAEGGRVRVIAEQPAPSVRELVEAGAEVLERSYRSEDFDETWLVVLADRDPALADRLAHETDKRRIFFCAVDDPRVGSFSHLAIARAGIVFAAIGTHGEAPALGRRLRELLSSLFDRAGLAEFASRHATLRRKTPATDRKRILGADVADLELTGDLKIPPRTSGDAR
jgi:precorrin-2 dehydrogenase / sirohydrochlorin ferrochelatase